MSEITLEELRDRLGEDGLVLVDVRSPLEHSGMTCAPCDPRPGRIPGSLGLPLEELFTLDGASIEARVGGPGSVRLVAYCHSGQRSAIAVELLTRHGYDAVNFTGSWHEWSRDETLPAEVDPEAPRGAHSTSSL